MHFIARRRRWLIVSGIILAGSLVAAGLYVFQQVQTDSNDVIRRWFREPSSRAGLTTSNDKLCANAQFILPSSGLIGLLWKDPAAPYNLMQRHTGIDIFGDGLPGSVPVVAAYDGYLTRLDSWVSSVIIRHDDPLHNGRTIWTYYTHMADRSGNISFIDSDFPPGTSEVFVTQGTRLGYQGEYSGAGAPIGMHVHLSMVTTNADGSFKNEAILDNTIDPSPYFGLPLNIETHPDRPIRCS